MISISSSLIPLTLKRSFTMDCTASRPHGPMKRTKDCGVTFRLQKAPMIPVTSLFLFTNSGTLSSSTSSGSSGTPTGESNTSFSTLSGYAIAYLALR